MFKHKFFLSSISIGLCILAAACTPHATSRNLVAANMYRDGFPNFGSPQLQVIGMDAAGNAYYDLPRDPGDEPDWSPDGKWIVARVGGGMAGSNADLVFMSADGNYKYQLFTPEQDEFDPSWSPDDKTVVYDSGYDDIYTMDTTCILQKEKCHPQPVLMAKGFRPTWSPDGKNIAFDKHISIFVVRLDGKSEPVQITSDEKQCTQPQWSPDGTQIMAICRDSISLVSPDGHSFVTLGVEGNQPSWYPDGSRIAFISGEGEGLGGMLGWETCNANAVFSIKPDGSDLQRITHGKNECILGYTWLPATPLTK